MLFEALLNKGDASPTFKREGGGVPKRSNGAGCKPVDFGLRKFESFPLHHSLKFIQHGAKILGVAGVVQW